MPEQRTVRLVGGPADGRVIDNYRGGPVLMHSDEHADMVARYRPTAPIMAFTPDARIARQLQLVWGVRPLVNDTEVGTLELWCISRDGKHRWKLEFNVREQRR